MQVLDALCHMDMVPHLGGLVLRRQGHRLIGDSKLGVHAHHARNHAALILQGVAYPGRVLQHSRPGLVLPVPVGNLIAQAGTHPELLRRVLDGEQAVVNLPKAGVMVKYRGHSILYRIQKSNPGALPCLLIGQMPVNGPPHAIQDIQKSLRVISPNR